MNKNNAEALLAAKGILLKFKQQDTEKLRKAFTVLLKYEEPEIMALDRRGSGGLFQFFKFKKAGLLVEKRDGEIIEVRAKKF